ncbi:hypothetical protein WJX81_002278 [Elliptochloris bilobata]|uniref:VASt domain-containing protein n=1 Tax=Elliptochloris bilobata TaxID=381761 RepID=A0AAW1QYA8_9CHLO
MVKEVTFSAEVPASVQEFYEAIFASSAVVDFHREYDGDACASVGPWVDDTRVVAFTVQLKLPAFVRRAIGTEALQVKELQRREWREGGAELAVSSEPRIEVPGGAQFTTSAHFLVTPRAANGAAAGCTVVATLTCSAAGPWGMVGAIETIMASQAQTSVGAFIDFCAHRCAGDALDAGSASNAALGLGLMSQPSGGDPNPEGSEDGAESIAAFYEAAESIAAMSEASGALPEETI